MYPFLTEISVTSANNKTTSTSSSIDGMISSRAVDGIYSTNAFDNSCSHTGNANNEWYEILNITIGTINGVDI